MSSPAAAQLGALISPGPLAKPHAKLEGISNCQQCHERGRRVIAEKCLACHAPIAERMARRAGVHKDVKGDCVTCHVEHAGVDAELRPFDQKAFDHAAATGFAIDGKHAPLASQCAACHKTRSFISLKTSCASCHTDVHKGRFGQSCSSCHSTRAVFKDFGGQFDHTKAAFQLTGAHQKVACASCHVNRIFKGLKFAACTDCHTSPHRAVGVVAATTQAPGFANACTTCHTSDSWRTKKVNHNQTAFPLVGRHTNVECASCHRQPAMKVKPKADTCAACHVDVHRGTFKQDCRSCHTETSFQKAPFDHTKTQFALTGKHEALACAACHKNAPAPIVARGAPGRAGPASGRGVPAARGGAAPRPASTPVLPAPVGDFRGLQTACVGCHTDVHRAELGSSCESCHSTTTFKQQQHYVHRRVADFFGGQHATVACAKCHLPEAPTRPVRTDASIVLASFKSTATTCVSCHRDVHLGQEGAACERCHTVTTAKFAVEHIAHAQFAFALTGRHEQVACASCHKVETGAFPAGMGTATRLKGVSHECRACHNDVHLGQLAGACETCHTTSTFHFTNYTHRNRSLASFFTGRHRTECAACHKPATGQFPAGMGTAIKFKVDTRCVACHEDIHRGSLGKNCSTCHRP